VSFFEVVELNTCFRTISTAYFRGAHGVILTYDVTNEQSFEHVEAWLQEVNDKSPKTIVKLLVGNKTDLESLRVVSTERGQGFASSHGLNFLETSAKFATNVYEAYDLLTQQALEAWKRDKAGTSNSETEIRPSEVPTNSCNC
jgi:Ras-related protein Rab-1A